MARVRNRLEGSARPGLPVDYSYLFGCRGGTVRHDPQVRFQRAGDPVDLEYMIVFTRPRTQAG